MFVPSKSTNASTYWSGTLSNLSEISIEAKAPLKLLASNDAIVLILVVPDPTNCESYGPTLLIPETNEPVNSTDPKEVFPTPESPVGRSW